jgi:hypothetical protein
MAHRRLAFETMGNATLVLLEDEAPLLATDPWLVGTAYFGSWALDHDLTPEQIGRVAAAPDVWTTSGWRRPLLRGLVARLGWIEDARRLARRLRRLPPIPNA